MKVCLNMSLVAVTGTLIIAHNAQASLVFIDICRELNGKAVIPPDFLLVCRYCVVVQQFSFPIHWFRRPVSKLKLSLFQENRYLIRRRIYDGACRVDFFLLTANLGVHRFHQISVSGCRMGGAINVKEGSIRTQILFMIYVPIIGLNNRYKHIGYTLNNHLLIHSTTQ